MNLKELKLQKGVDSLLLSFLPSTAHVCAYQFFLESLDKLQILWLSRVSKDLVRPWSKWVYGDDNDESLKTTFITAMRAVDDQLAESSGPYFLEDFSLVDISIAPNLERMDASLTYYKGYQIRNREEFKNITRWFEAMETRPTYIATKADYYTHAHSSVPVLGKCSVSMEGAPFASRIDDEGFSLPLESLSAQSFEPYTAGDNPNIDKYHAAKRLVENRAAVTMFACRNTGEEAAPVRAPFSNPNAKPNEDIVPAVEAALRHAAHALLISVEAKQEMESGSLRVASTSEYGYLDGAPCYAALKYLRDRVGVPRDLYLPSARQLRAHLTWIMESLRIA